MCTANRRWYTCLAVGNLEVSKPVFNSALCLFACLIDLVLVHAEVSESVSHSVSQFISQLVTQLVSQSVSQQSVSKSLNQSLSLQVVSQSVRQPVRTSIGQSCSLSVSQLANTSISRFGVPSDSQSTIHSLVDQHVTHCQISVIQSVKLWDRPTVSQLPKCPKCPHQFDGSTS